MEETEGGGERRLTKAEAKTTHRLDPHWGVRLGGSLAGVPGHVLGCEWADGVRDIVGAVGDRHDLVALLAEFYRGRGERSVP